MFRILIVTTDNEPGVLDRVASTFRRRGFNIHSLTVSPTLDPLVSRMTLVTDMNAKSPRSAKAFLERLLNVHSVVDLTEAASLVRDVAMLRVRATAESRPGLFQLAQIFHAEVLDVSPDSLVMSVCASPERIEALLESLRPFGLLELGRSGAVAMQRSSSIEVPLAAEEIDEAVSF
jgi:acetolactate synthase-1/3 small subunit